MPGPIRTEDVILSTQPVVPTSDLPSITCGAESAGGGAACGVVVRGGVAATGAVPPVARLPGVSWAGVRDRVAAGLVQLVLRLPGLRWAGVGDREAAA